MIIAISIVTVLVSIILGLVAIVCVSLFSSAKYSNTQRIDELEAQMAEWQGRKQANPAEIHERLVTLENRAGVMIGTRR